MEFFEPTMKTEIIEVVRKYEIHYVGKDAREKAISWACDEFPPRRDMDAGDYGYRPLSKSELLVRDK